MLCYWIRQRKLPPPRKADVARVLSGKATFHIGYCAFFNRLLRGKNPFKKQYVGWHYYANKKCCRISKSDLRLTKNTLSLALSQGEESAIRHCKRSEAIQPMDCHVANAPRNDTTLFAKQTVKDLLTYSPTNLLTNKPLSLTLSLGEGNAKKRVTAFTLAEVLITLGIIGIVAAMTMPAVIEKHQKQVTVSKLKKAYSTLSQAFVSSVADNENAANWVDTNVIVTEENAKEYFDKYWAPYIRVLKFCDSKTSCGYKEAPKTYGGNPTSLGFFGGKRVSLLTPDGMYMLFRTYDDNNGTFSKLQLIWVDINAGRSPNIYGKDIFLFSLDLNNAKLNPYGISFTKEGINSYCYGENAGHFTSCARKIMNDGWQITYY